MTPRLLLRPGPALRGPRAALRIAALLAGLAGALPPAGAWAAAPDSLATPDPGAPPSAAAASAPPGPVSGFLAGARRPDRVAHLSLALALGVGAGLATREPAAGAGAALTLAAAKELLDDRGDRGDLAAGAAGAALAWLIVAALTR